MKIGLINTALNEDAPPLNLVYLATVLRLNGFSEVKIIDHTFRRRSLYREVKGFDCIGISAMTRYYNKACRIAKQIKESTGIPVIIGGSHITTASSSLSPNFVLGIIGEGESIIVELCQSLYQEGSFNAERLKEICGLVYWDNGKLTKTPAAPLIDNLDDIPLPDFGLLDEHYFRRKWIIWNETMGRSMKIITSRGCPYNCVFCASKRIWKVVRLHSAERIFKEAKELVSRWGIDHIYIDDDLFIINKARLEQFAELMEQNMALSNKVAFFCSARTDLLDETVCQILRRIGVRALNFGFESGSDRVLRYLKGDNIAVESHRKALDLCNKYGFKVWGSLMLGSPTETIEDMRKTSQFIDFAITHGCQRLGAFVATPLPGTEFWEIARQSGKVSDDMNWDLIDYGNCYKPLVLEPNINPDEFRKIFAEITVKLDRLLVKDKGWKTIILRYRKVIYKILDNPKRAFTMFKNIFFRKSNISTQ